MKKIAFTIAFLCSCFIQAQTAEKPNGVEPPVQVVKVFEKDFPKIKPFWRKEFDGEDNDQLSYEADFKINDTNMTAVYNALGQFQVLQIEVKNADIPVKIKDYMSREYPKNNIKKAARMMTNENQITYEIGITINEKWVVAVFNKEGDFLKMDEKD